ncbi:MAG TPA: biotin/lipoyl-containing protein, partial [Sphingomonadales bacterium]|nr:biotin/lipoyl-containing protein [Sphingomonadales bacterium]
FPAPLTCLNSEAGGADYALSTYCHENSVYVMAGGNTAEAILEDAAHAGEEEAEGPGLIKAPMPGKILDVLAKDGQKVKKGDALIIMEAMKMEYTLKAPRDGKVKGLNAKAGEQVAESKVLLEIEE